MPHRPLEELEAEISAAYDQWTVERMGKGKRQIWYARLIGNWQVIEPTPHGYAPPKVPQQVAYERESAIRRLHEQLFDPANRVVLIHGDAPGIKPPADNNGAQYFNEQWADAVNEAAQRPNCSQCGQPFAARACGPTHAIIRAARAKAENRAAGPVSEMPPRPDEWSQETADILVGPTGEMGLRLPGLPGARPYSDNCRHERLNEDGICRTCGEDRRGA